MTEEEIEGMFENIDFNHDGEINYTEFLAVACDKSKATSLANLRFAFHHFDIDDSGYITQDNLIECFRREGKHLTQAEVADIVE